MAAEGIRVELDDRSEKIGYKIREAQMQKIPYMLILGDREMEENKVNLRSRDQGELGAVPSDDLMAQLKAEISLKALPAKQNRGQSGRRMRCCTHGSAF
jgi:threonyl-tRNA synthetase